ncbi:hypothetical protein [Actinocrispum wychmicini]|uniref:Uncharacterized protein n=1 Tax=Actinocrispum wychmicini TaxID=1213861 RepID=A0A4R2JYD9_9PSEU|nr:hypothetical protein [Actinocrispum wychmicini]TCO62269.1 hypothetical protein EV192_102406 [Actinocrispum wychmicini]
MIGWVLRIVVAAALLGSAGVHYFLWTQGYSGIVSALFLLNAIGGVVLAIAVLLWRHWLPPLGAIGFGVLTLGSYVLAATIGFLGQHDQFNSQPEYWGVITDAVCVLGGVALLLIPNRNSTLSNVN